jgi:predicted nuclease of restriction endonuclease-like (RecB) superfamily
MNPPLTMRPEGYEDFLRDLKPRIRTAQVRAVLAVNRELVRLYWQIGRDIIERQDQAGWGAKIIESLASDLHHEFPDMKGFSARNLKYMRALAEAYPDPAFVQHVVAQIPWGHNLRILDGTSDRVEREWYIRQTVQNGWSRNVLVHQIESGLYRRQGKAQTNFTVTLPAPQSDLAQQVLEDPYNFDFLMLAEGAMIVHASAIAPPALFM